jgi:flagellar hook-associated protein 1 FlgK
MSNNINIGLNASLLMGLQSMNAQQVAIQTVGNNISNVNTPGYARQRANLSNADTVYGNQEVGTGVNVTDIESLRSSLLDGLVQQSLGDQGYADNSSSLSSAVQSALGEEFTAASSSSSGASDSSSGAVQSAFASFFSSLQTLASTPNDPTARQQVVQDGASLATSISGAYSRLQQAQSQIATDAGSVVTQINQLSTSIASLNQQITQVQASGGTANDLIDTRTSDVDTLSGLVNVNVSNQANGAVNITLADAPSVSLVTGSDGGGAGSTQTLSVAYNANSATPLTVSASTAGPLGTGIPSSGSLGAHLDVVNNVIGSPGSSGDTGLLGSLDDITAQLISQVNTQSEQGYDLNGTKGTAFFTGIGAASIAVNPTVAADPSLIAAGNGTGPLDGSNAVAMANIQNSSNIIPAFQTMVSNLGETVSTAASNQSTQDQLTQQLQTQQQSVSGVSIDEEMTNLISYQQAYAASARFLTTISNLYGTLMSEGTTT